MLPYLEKVDGIKCKNFFLRDKKGKLFVLSAPHDRKIDMGGLSKIVGAKNLRFAPDDMLRDVLGVEPGCLCPFAIANDVDKQVGFLVDKALISDPKQKLLFHPMVNTASLSVTAQGLCDFAKHTGHHVKTLKLT